jgi:hypothetical protein
MSLSNGQGQGRHPHLATPILTKVHFLLEAYVRSGQTRILDSKMPLGLAYCITLKVTEPRQSLESKGEVPINFHASE